MQAKPTTELPPQDIYAEAALLGGVMRDNQVYDDVRVIVSPDDFYLDAHRKLASAIFGMVGRDKPCDLALLFDVLKSAGHLEDIGGAAYIAACYEKAPTAANAVYYAKIVKEMATRRRLIHLCTEVMRDAQDGVMPAAELVARFESDVFAVADASTQNEPVLIGPVIRQVMADLEAPPEQAGPMVRTGIGRMDGILGRLKPGQLIVIAARPSVGKSALAQQIAFNNAADGNAALFFSLEMPKEEVAQRALAQGCQVPLNAITGSVKLEQAFASRLIDGVNGCIVPVWIDDRAGHNFHTIAATARRAVRKHGAKLVVVDYLQLIEHEGNKNDSMATRVGNTSRGMKVLARQLGVPVICLSQLSRDIEKRGDGKPQLSDLRDSGAIEQDADGVIMLHPQPVPMGGPPPKEQEIHACIEKQRAGPKGKAELVYERATLTFRDSNNSFM
jgi:replicative DNA helicase